MEYKYKILNKDLVYDGFHKIELFNFQYTKFDNSQSHAVTRELCQRRSCVGMLPYDPLRQEIILIEQIRIGPLAHNEHPWLFEIVAGIVEDDETCEQTIIREAKEEANCEITKLIGIYDYFLSPGGNSEKIKLYIGITNTAHAGGIFGLEQEDEDIKVHVVSVNKAFDMLEQGKINNSSTIIALQWLQHNIKNTELFL